MNTALNFLFPVRLRVVLGAIWSASVILATAESNLPPATELTTAIPEADLESEADRIAALKLQEQLQLQAQLQAAKLALERNRLESEALSNAIAGRLHALERAVQQKQDAETANLQAQLNTVRKDLESNNRLLVIVGGGIAAVGFFVLLATGYLQWRSVNRLAEFSAVVQAARTALAAPAAGMEAPLLGAGAAAPANTKLLGTISQLEQRILELEHNAHTSATPLIVAANGTNGANGDTEPAVPKPGPTPNLPAAALLAKGQSLLSADQPTAALACFEELLQTEPHHGEALVKKGMALEQLGRTDEALECYDRAIAAQADLTIAYLQKGGLFNRLERYEEALQCYEQALHAQEKAQHA